ncbi:hypothetical protein [Bacillus sonorensis]|uniref:hypothetical protein n=1 Tax=Bacillus sonorensis TaxID=119858 RepID=UPI002DBFDD28|nr:hypothetical protein [Bacillus sonorensis]MEC0341881.1 hypothetical protein [Bacillus sonorensis]MEC0457433.1 hypothetical protein [Bacillus sonorensis]MEC0530772.1 hypothetical protein [Bacillus sonorensis]
MQSRRSGKKKGSKLVPISIIGSIIILILIVTGFVLAFNYNSTATDKSDAPVEKKHVSETPTKAEIISESASAFKKLDDEKEQFLLKELVKAEKEEDPSFASKLASENPLMYLVVDGKTIDKELLESFRAYNMDYRYDKNATQEQKEKSAEQLAEQGYKTNEEIDAFEEQATKEFDLEMSLLTISSIDEIESVFNGIPLMYQKQASNLPDDKAYPIARLYAIARDPEHAAILSDEFYEAVQKRISEGRDYSEYTNYKLMKGLYDYGVLKTQENKLYYEMDKLFSADKDNE